MQPVRRDATALYSSAGARAGSLHAWPHTYINMWVLFDCCTQGTVSGQRDKLAEVESALAALRSSSSEREQATAALEADLRAKLKEAEEMVRACL